MEHVGKFSIASMARLIFDSLVFFVEIRTFELVWLASSLRADSSQLINKMSKNSCSAR
jgi:hypothetical protein